MNRGIKVLQTSALPLGYVASMRASALKYNLAIRNGLEPSTSSVTGWHSNQLNYRTVHPADKTFTRRIKYLVGAIGLEPMTLCL